MLAAGGEAIADIDTLRQRAARRGGVPGRRWWRSLDRGHPGGVAAGGEDWAKIRRRVWSLLPAVSASKVAGTDLGGVIVLYADATLVISEPAWTPAITADGEVREHADVAEITGLLDSSRWPDGMRVIVRRKHPHPGAQLSLFEAQDGFAIRLDTCRRYRRSRSTAGRAAPSPGRDDDPDTDTRASGG